MSTTTADTVSVIIPTHNHAGCVGLAIQSALNQTHHPAEILVVDDESTDDTPARVAAFGPPVKYLWRPNGGCAAARNTGIRAAQGEWLAFLDSDDLWEPTKLERQLRRAHEPPEAKVVYTAMRVLWHGGRSTESHGREEDRLSLLDRLMVTNCITGSASAVLARRTCFEQVGLFDETMTSCQDWDMWFRLCRCYRFGYVDEVLTTIVDLRESMSSNGARLCRGRMQFLGKHGDFYRVTPGGRKKLRIALSRTSVIAAQTHAENGRYNQARHEYVEALKRWPFSMDVYLALLRGPRAARARR